MRCKNIFIFIFGVFLLGLASADFVFSTNGSSITTQYEANDSIKADLNISFFNESLNSTFSDSLGNSIQLGDLLAINSDYDYLFYDLTNTTISSAYQTLKLGEAGFNIPSGTGNITYTLSFKGTVLFTRTLQLISTKNLIDKTLQSKYSQLNITKTEIAKYDPSVQKVLNESLNITYIEDNLSRIETQYANAVTAEEYTQILDNLSTTRIPSSISETIITSSITFYPSRENINLDVLANIDGGSYGNNQEGYKDAVYSWNDKNLKTNLTFTEISINYASGQQSTLRIFQFDFDKSKMTKNAYFIVQNVENIKFEDIPSSQIVESTYGYSYINLNDISDKIVFSTTGNVDFLNIPAFISPSLNDLTPAKVEPWTPWKDNKKSKWILFAVIIFIVLLIGVITYVLLQNWYRRKYEVHLFKNRNNLFNIMNYIQNAKKKNMPRGEIVKNLKKAGWTGEQINYALRKYEGKKIAGLIKNPFNITPETEKIDNKNTDKRAEKKTEPNSKPVYKTFNVDPGAEKKPGQDNNTKV